MSWCILTENPILPMWSCVPFGAARLFTVRPNFALGRVNPTFAPGGSGLGDSDREVPLSGENISKFDLN